MRSTVVEEDLQAILARPLPWGRLEGATVAVTGANGFLPAYMVETLLRRNEGISEHHARSRTQVVGLVRNRKRAETRFADYLGRPDFRLVAQDVCEPLAITGGVDYIVHAASQASPRYFGADPVGTLMPNVVGTANVLRLAAASSAKGVLYFSSSEVYGSVGINGAIPESAIGNVDPLEPRSCYAESKRMGEAMCVAWHRQFGVPAVIVRPFHTYGPGMRLDDGRVFADFVRDAVQGREIVLRSAGTARRAFCYLADATAAFFLALLSGVGGEAYNVGNPDAEVSIAELAELLAGLGPGQRLRVVRAPEAQGRYLASGVERNCPDIARIKALGWRAQVGPREGFARTIRTYLGASMDEGEHD